MLTHTAEYAVRVMHVLSRVESGRRARASDLGPRSHVPPAYLSKVLARLVKAGLVHGVKGHHGGFQLARPAHEIRLLDIISAVEDWTDFENKCYFGFDQCTPHLPCPLHPTFGVLKVAVIGWASDHTLQDMGAPGPATVHDAPAVEPTEPD